ncbi:auxin-responsive protein IAA26-like [Daucus carota subsp. sativus]|uniref:auxin-responsive protein IAA26-like n=1 Tax=Daucus carota subsp. sativus TaxID=79200 RepID=UPI0007EF817E|nr:PREDICTED: auxin-responsive protein IAA26-like [Daucus carota subsp. sativus]
MERYPVRDINSNKRSHETGHVSQDKSLELKLAPPGENKPLISLHYISHKSHSNDKNKNLMSSGTKRDFLDTIIGEKGRERNWLTGSGDQGYQSGVNLGAPNSSKRMDVRPIVGWPPVRSSRRNLLSSSNSSKLETDSSKNGGKKGEKPEITEDSLFVKIKMDGVPIGRKVDLKSYSDYDNLSSAVDELFRGLLAAQGEISSSEKEKMEKTKTITGLLDGRGDYTLVYEDSEGDRMLVGDVPWQMFISSAKRLRVLKEISSSYLRKI